MKVSILLPLALTASLTTAFVVIPDEQTIKQVGFESHQAPIAPEERPIGSGVDGDKPARKPCHKNFWKRQGLRPEYVLRRHLRGEDASDPIKVEFETYEGLNPSTMDLTGVSEREQHSFFDAYRTFGRNHPHHEGKPIDAAAEEHGSAPEDWPPNPPNPPGDWPKPTGEWPPKPTGRWPPKHPKHPPPHHPPPHHHHKPNATIWELISKSNFTSKFAEAVSEFPEIVSILNGTISNYTLFVPTNKALEKLPKHGKEPPKELIKKALTYHISSEFYPVFKILLGHTIPSSLNSDELGGPQRIKVGLGPHGLRVNFYSRVLAANIFATNGVIHAIDAPLFPPPPAAKIISFFPNEFSTFELALHLTGLPKELPQNHTGGTFFAPPNEAFKKLGPKVNAFLFSPWGRKYLKALLQYHFVYNETLYSDAYYHPTVESGFLGVPRATGLPKGHYHVDLPTLLAGKHLSIDINHFGPFINIIINGQSSVKVQDLIAKDGVIQIVGAVLLPPRKPPASLQALVEEEELELIESQHGGITVEAFKERFEGLVEEVNGEELYSEEDLIAMWDV